MTNVSNRRSMMGLFSGNTCIRSHQVRFVLREKGITTDIQNVDGKKVPEDLIALNPYASIPTLTDRELVIYDSGVIIEYLDERYPHPPLMPVYPVARGNSRLMMYRIERNWYSVAEKIVKGNAEESEAARVKLRNDLLTLAPIFAEYEYFMSEEFSLIDCYLAPLLWRLPELGIELIGPGSKELKIYMNRVFERDSFLASLTEAEREMRLVR